MYVRVGRNPRTIHRVRLRFTRTKNNKTFRVLREIPRRAFSTAFRVATTIGSRLKRKKKKTPATIKG